MADYSNQLVLASRRGRVLILTFNRPERLNAWTPDLEDEYFDHLDAADADGEVRAIVITGAGRGFCAGADMSNLSRVSQGGDRIQRPRHRATPVTARKPMIAAINGAAAGLGLIEALYCDVRFCVPTAKITTSFVRRGLIAEHGLAWLMPRLVGTGRANDLLLSGRIIDGNEAYRIGLVEFLSEPEDLIDDAVAYATDIAENTSPTSVAIIKDQLRDAAVREFLPSCELASNLTERAVRRPDFREGVRSYTEKRSPNFTPLPPKSDGHF